MIGPGKYDYALTSARVNCGATAAALIVFDGENGAGFSLQAPPGVLKFIPDTLREIAAEIEADLEKGKP